jgi:hypothetical protein
MLVAELAQTLKVSVRRRQDTACSGNGLNYYGSDRWAIHCKHAFQRVGKVCPMNGLPATEGIAA